VALTPWSPPSSPRLHAGPDHLLDEAGRVAVLRGVNVRVAGLFDARVDPERCTPPTDVLEAVPALTDGELDRMADLGFSVIRLPVNWSAIEPTEGTYDEAYLDRVEDLVGRAGERGIATMIDVHQDAWSPDLGEDGAPLWATYGDEGPTDPSLLLCGPLGDSLADRRVSAPVAAAFRAFFAPDSPVHDRLEAAFAAMLVHVVERLEASPVADAVLGYEIFNEPVYDDRTLRAFHERMTAAIHARAPGVLVFFEPSALRNLSERGFLSGAPFAGANAVYAPHLYTLAFMDPMGELDRVTPEILAPNFDRMLAERAAWHVPLFVGEWGIRPDSPGTADYIAFTYDLFDAASTSSAVWLWKEASQGSWGFYGCDEADETFASCEERPEQFAAHARIYAERIAGTPLPRTEADPAGAAHYDRARRRYELRFEGRSDDAPHVLRIPADYPAAFEVRCDGALLEEVAREPRTGRIEVVCAGPGRHLLAVAPAL
jgi:endoglycosylceramidase